MKKIILAVLIGALLVPAAFAKEEAKLDEKMIALCNEVMVNIYYDILAQKDKYDSLSQFGEGAFYKNNLGIYTIIYEQVVEVQAPGGNVKKNVPFAFGLTIDRIPDQTIEPQRQPFAFGFPVLGLKISGFQNKKLLRTQFDLTPLIAKHGKLLNNYQQEFLPLRLTLTPVKDAFSVREDVEFEVRLTNTSKANMLVTPPSPKNLFFTVNGRPWGVNFFGGAGAGPKKTRQQLNRERIAKRRASRKSKNEKRQSAPGLLNGGESMSLILRGESFQVPQEVEIQALYSVLIKGVNPIASLKINIVK